MKKYPFSLHPAILQCCRKFHAEGIPVLYSNRFKVSYLTDEVTSEAPILPRPFLATITTISSFVPRGFDADGLISFFGNFAGLRFVTVDLGPWLLSGEKTISQQDFPSVLEKHMDCVEKTEDEDFWNSEGLWGHKTFVCVKKGIWDMRESELTIKILLSI
jgi:hypothetical protein